MITYVKPSIAKCGTSESVIKGQCGWGKENFTVDKTGATKTKTIKRKVSYSCYGPGVVNICFKCQTFRNQCTTESSNC
ncbi:hypothetical protein [Bacillus cereus]|uniref:Uncharacterized protein n=1 Tax=Bacillus cereus TaxID=1396 RepID=A0AA44Q6F7_BACCE|nr:hypothetical protein [Bacillus cereus]PFN00480.1 hypothetical protein COJ55_25035 [Bacillus cereus]PFR90749.1 hypothetical protein COK38_23290 [Bacillus cereus]